MAQLVHWEDKVCGWVSMVIREDLERKIFSTIAEAVWLRNLNVVESSEDPFETYTHELKLNLLISPDIFSSRLLRGYRVLEQAQRDKAT